VDDLGIMAPEERRLVMQHTFSPLRLGPAVGAYARQTIHGMLEHWAAATPGAPAVSFQVRCCVLAAMHAVSMARILSNADDHTLPMLHAMLRRKP
jgi:hypothetical protein